MFLKEQNSVAIQSFLSKKAKLEDLSLRGKGVFATERIFKDELVAMWGGQIYSREQFNSLTEDFRNYILQIDTDLFIGPSNESSVDDAEFFNHSCDPNCGIRGQIALVAMRDIEPGEELTFDYSMAEDYDQQFDCHCGATDCRRIIRGSDHMLPELQRKYQGYFSQWIEKKHAASVDELAYQLRFQATGAWGLVTALDLHDCNPQTIRSADKIRQFTIELCERIGVKRFGEPTVVHFGEDERVAGYSLVQLIETSLVSGHFANATNRVYLDIFSCAYYNINETIEFSRSFFEAGHYNSNVYLRH